jgi:hypothetical protein
MAAARAVGVGSVGVALDAASTAQFDEVWLPFPAGALAGFFNFLFDPLLHIHLWRDAAQGAAWTSRFKAAKRSMAMEPERTRMCLRCREKELFYRPVTGAASENKMAW